MKAYARFGAMIATSTLVMLGLMYLNTYRLDHVFFSETRTYMALIMGATMAVVMLAYMMDMYRNQRANIGIVCTSRRTLTIVVSCHSPTSVPRNESPRTPEPAAGPLHRLTCHML